ncbi:MAG: hypothetical protein AAF212_02225 [Verrucomicrobiota bacterium]
MAHPTEFVITKLREAADRLARENDYHWGHTGRCNCGTLAQCITDLTPVEIYRRSQAQRLGEWSEFAEEYCPESGAPVDSIIDTMIQAGFNLKDIRHLEHLSDRSILRAIPGGPRYLRKSDKQHVILYMRTWAGLLELEAKEASRKRKRARVNESIAQEFR